MTARDAVLATLATRASGATICPSEAARALISSSSDTAEPDWRSAMPAVHAAIDLLVSEEQVRLSWKGKMLPFRKGPYRIGRCTPD